MSSAGSPAWASSQSSTARSPSGPTRRLPIRKSPWTVTRCPSGRAVGGQPAHAELERRPDLAEPVEERERVARTGRGAAARRSASGSMRVDGGQGAAALGRERGAATAHSSSRSILRGIVSPSRRSTTSQPGARSSAFAQPPRRRAPARRRLRRPSRAASVPDAAARAGVVPRSCWRMSGRGRVPACLEVERAGDPRGAAGEPAQVAHGAFSRRPSAPASSSRAASWTPSTTRRGRQASRRRRAGGGTRRCRSRSAPGPPGPRSVHRVSPSLTMVPPARPMSATRSTSPRSG